MRAVILVGGEGRRLRPLTDTRPKPMMSLVDRPFIHHQLDHLRRHGITDIVFSCGYLPAAIEEYFGDGSGVGVSITYVVDPFPLGTAGAIANAREHLGDDAVLVANGDILTDLDIGALLTAHRESGALGTIALTPVEDPSAFGLVRLHADRRVEEFLEKPSRDQLRPGEPFLINAGTYVLDPSLIAAIPVGVATSIERDTFPAVAAEGGLYGFASDAYWRDIGTHGSYLSAHHDVLGARVRTDAVTGERYLGTAVEIAPGARVDGLSSVGEGAVIGAGATVVASVLGAGARVGRGASLDGAIIGAGARIDEGCVIQAGAVVGDGARVGAGSRLTGEARVATGAHIQPGSNLAAPPLEG